MPQGSCLLWTRCLVWRWCTNKGSHYFRITERERYIIWSKTMWTIQCLRVLSLHPLHVYISSGFVYVVLCLYISLRPCICFSSSISFCHCMYLFLSLYVSVCLSPSVACAFIDHRIDPFLSSIRLPPGPFPFRSPLTHPTNTAQSLSTRIPDRYEQVQF